MPISGLALRQGIGVTLVGIRAGVVGSIWATLSLQGVMFGVGSFQPSTLIRVSTILLFVAVIAAYVPARRATRIDPIAALRAE